MNAIERLTALFERFPGIGPRQAGRFVQFLLRSSPATRKEFIESMQALGESVHQCRECMRYFSGESKICDVCASTKRDKKFLVVVATDADLAAFEKTGAYKGVYFVLGGTLSLASEKTSGLRLKQLLSAVQTRAKEGLAEIILAFPANPEGDATATRIREELLPLTKKVGIQMTALGRGLSTGSELEYADPETIHSALESRR